MERSDLYSNPVLYEREYSSLKDDLEFWKMCAATYNGDWLELGCGGGRIAKEIAPLLFSYSGLDLSKEMIDAFKNQHPEVFENNKNQIWNADIREFNLSKKFDVILLPFNTLAHMYTKEDFQKMSFCIKNHLKESGLFIIDYFNPDFRFLIDRKEFVKYNEFTMPDDGVVVAYETNHYCRDSQINYIKYLYQYKERPEKEVTATLSMRIYFPQELDHMLYSNGFKIKHKYGDYNKNEFDENSEKQIIIAEIN